MLALDRRDHAKPGQSLEIFGDLLDRCDTDGGRKCVAYLADAAVAVDQVERLIAERRPFPVRLARLGVLERVSG